MKNEKFLREYKRKLETIEALVSLIVENNNFGAYCEPLETTPVGFMPLLTARTFFDKRIDGDFSNIISTKNYMESKLFKKFSEFYGVNYNKYCELVASNIEKIDKVVVFERNNNLEFEQIEGYKGNPFVTDRDPYYAMTKINDEFWIYYPKLIEYVMEDAPSLDYEDYVDLAFQKLNNFFNSDYRSPFLVDYIEMDNFENLASFQKMLKPAFR